ncbi:MAG: DEAD/DEAH box helicase, partial [Candidatus Latescibacteria bacterium]|nr:DEAD/DEAH box helicase [Candidatus Latescibacterota bacterium]
MDVDAFLKDLKTDPGYRGQMACVREIPAREAEYGSLESLSAGMAETAAWMGIQRVYSHQAEAIEQALAGRDVLVSSGTASGKTLCYTLPIVQKLQEDPEATALLLFPTKALTQDQFKGFSRLMEAAGLTGRLAGVYDGDTPPATRRKLRDHGAVIFSNPDMIHAGIMPHHARWARFLQHLSFLVLDELHVYNGIFGSNMALMLRRLGRVCEHYGSRPQIVS